MKRAYRRTPQGTLRRLYKRVGGVVRWLGGCCCGGGGWIRAVACRVDTTPQVIVVIADPLASPSCSVGGSCPVPGGLTVVYRNRCYVIESGPEELPPECQNDALVFAARIYESQPPGELIARFDCLPPEETCESSMCQLPPPIGCCIEAQSIGCNGPRLCEGGKDVTMRYESYEDTITYRFNGTIFERLQITQLWVVRKRCVGTSPVTTIDPSSFRETVFTDSNGVPRTTRVQPLTNIGGEFREPGIVPSPWSFIYDIIHNGCTGVRSDPSFFESWNVVSGCRSGNGTLLLRDLDGTFVTRQSTRDGSWSWTVPLACTRGSGLGDLPL